MDFFPKKATCPRPNECFDSIRSDDCSRLSLLIIGCNNILHVNTQPCRIRLSSQCGIRIRHEDRLGKSDCLFDACLADRSLIVPHRIIHFCIHAGLVLPGPVMIIHFDIASLGSARSLDIGPVSSGKRAAACIIVLETNGSARITSPSPTGPCSMTAYPERGSGGAAHVEVTRLSEGLERTKTSARPGTRRLLSRWVQYGPKKVRNPDERSNWAPSCPIHRYSVLSVVLASAP